MKNEREQTLLALGAEQHGVVARRQIRDIGFDATAIRRRVRQGRLERLTKRVYRIGGAAPTDRSRLMAATLEVGFGASLSHGSAAAMWEQPGFRFDPIHVTGWRPTTKNGDHELAVVHQPRRLLPNHLVELDLIAVTTPTRTIFDLAGVRWMHPKQVERVHDNLWARGRVSHASLIRMLGELGGRGRPGITLMQELLEDRPANFVPPESGAEGRFAELTATWGYRFERQVDIGGEDAWIGRVDFVDTARGIVVEVDPSLHHSSLTDRRNDEARHGSLRAAGLTVVSVTER
ncbi:MAG: type IV toxin-antitoxin system AbiEi family antitoxin domain-containing protein [Acidimicrobiales bacterium]|nr:type IV toxin-antitoxin system AbiEi family antitoxin domain-containing protein [Acidimicrobiales bacterium]